MNCCGDPYTRKFNAGRARAELADYRKDRIKKNSRPFINALKKLNLEGTSVLDIGGGVGVIVFELLKSGIKNAVHVELSDAYVKAFREESVRQSVDKKITSLQGDFLALHQQIEQVDLVSLDKVICCYLNYRELVALSAQKARRWYGYVIPIDTWWVKFFDYLKQGIQQVFGKGLRTYVHPVAEIEKIVYSEGFDKIFEQRNREWLTLIFERTTRPELSAIV